MGYTAIKTGKNPPNDIYVVIEIAAHSSPVKYEIDKDSDCLLVDRFVATAMFYPANYGYIPHTLCDDGDALDALVLTPYDIQPGVVINTRPVGVLYMEDESGRDEKILAVPTAKLTTAYNGINDIDDVAQTTKDAIEHYFSHYKDLEKGKWVKIDGWGTVTDAKKVIGDAISFAKSN